MTTQIKAAMEIGILPRSQASSPLPLLCLWEIREVKERESLGLRFAKTHTCSFNCSKRGQHLCTPLQRQPLVDCSTEHSWNQELLMTNASFEYNKQQPQGRPVENKTALKFMISYYIRIRVSRNSISFKEIWTAILFAFLHVNGGRWQTDFHTNLVVY